MVLLTGITFVIVLIISTLKKSKNWVNFIENISISTAATLFVFLLCLGIEPSFEKQYVNEKTYNVQPIKEGGYYQETAKGNYIINVDGDKKTIYKDDLKIKETEGETKLKEETIQIKNKTLSLLFGIQYSQNTKMDYAKKYTLYIKESK